MAVSREAGAMVEGKGCVAPAAASTFLASMGEAATADGDKGKGPGATETQDMEVEEDKDLFGDMT
jgi:hypothetical protein